MASANYVLLEKITVGAAGASSVTFNSIPQTGYTDLVIKSSVRSTSTGGELRLTFNSATTNYSNLYLQANPAGGTPVQSGTNAAAYIYCGEIDYSTYTASTFSNGEIYIPNYASSNYKSLSVDNVLENNATADYLHLVAGLWSNTAAITSIGIATSGANTFAQYSTFYLYGVAKLGTTPAIVPYATGGDTIMTDGTYWYHAFKASGTFTPAKGLSCDVLVVAGGGGGGNTGGGGGAGGVFYATSQSLASGTGYTATIGAGGVSGAAAGSDSTFASLTAAKGGGTGGAQSSAGLSGGSGGGSWSNSAGGATTQTSTGGTGYGFVGGGSVVASAGHGGGGAGAAGGVSPVAPAAGGNGGAGLNTWATWLNTTGTGVSGYIAGGGGGIGQPATTPATGGAGGGGAGAAYANDGTAGTANTGGGGGAWVTTFRSGGSGLIVLRYAI